MTTNELQGCKSTEYFCQDSSQGDCRTAVLTKSGWEYRILLSDNSCFLSSVCGKFGV